MIKAAPSPLLSRSPRFNEQHVEPDDLVNINGSLDRKMTPPVVRIDRLLKQSPK
ncbi:Putative periplasmic protein [Klebsiella pneumoniae IS43]|uniref:Periplasmic protein n=1 Tax=Klebsiella pneumoniae IS43 TaxID=1432552 RepID=W1DNJ0_KLEPN|nr:Putative periplasmic protein [Klebsiella pneumoniae IS43]